MLQAIQAQLGGGAEFTTEDLIKVSQGLSVPPGVVRESLLDLTNKTLSLASSILEHDSGQGDATASRSSDSSPASVRHRPPTLGIHTVYFDDSDRTDAERLGIDLYETLTRPVNDPLAFGAGIPVFCAVKPESVDLSSALHVVLLCVLGKTAFNMRLETVLSQLRDWHAKLGSGHVLPVPTASNWRSVEGRMPGKPFLTELYGPEDRRQATTDEIVLAVARILERDALQTTLFVSHAKADLAQTEDAAQRILEHVVLDTTGKAFFDRTQLLPGEPLSTQIDRAAGRGVFVAVRGDAYSSRIWCQRELMTAKRQGLPTLSVEILRRGEHRSAPYGGNGPTFVWNGDARAVVSRALVEWLALHTSAWRPIALKNLPDCLMKSRH